MTTPAPQPSGLSFLRNRAALRRIAMVTAGFVMAGVVYWLVAPRWYRSTLAVVPSAQPKGGGISSLLGGDLGGLAAGLGGAVGSSDVARIAAVLQSANVSDAVVKNLDLVNRYGASNFETARDELWKHCDVRLLPKPGIVQMTCEDKDPRGAQAILEAFSEYGNQAFRRVNVGSASEEVRYLERRVTELRQQAAGAATRMREFQEKHQIVELDSQARAVVSALAMLNSQRIEKQMELGYARTFSSRDASATRQLESQLEVVEETLRELEGSGPGALPGSGGAQAKGRGGKVFPAAVAVPQLRSEYENLFRDRKVAEATLLFALDRLENARAAEARDVSTFQVLDTPTRLPRHHRPRGTETVIEAALLGLLVGAVLEWWRARRATG